MNGRQEKDMKIETRIRKKLTKYPEILTEYYYSLSNKTATTKDAYIKYIIKFLDYCNGDYINVSMTDLNRYADHIKYKTDNKGGVKENSTSMRRTTFFAISNFYSFLVKKGDIHTNPCDNIELPKLKDEIKVVSLNPSEINFVKNNIANCSQGDEWKSRDMALISLGISTGLRVSALVNINMRDIDFDNNTIMVTEKGDVRREVYFGNKTKDILEDWIYHRTEIDPDTDALFISQYRKRLSIESVRKCVAKYTKGLDKHITPHKLRSTCGRNLYQKTHDIYLVQQVLGHRNIENTRRYTDVSSEEKRAAADILDSL